MDLKINLAFIDHVSSVMLLHVLLSKTMLIMVVINVFRMVSGKAVTFSESDSPFRIDADFDEMKDENHHLHGTLSLLCNLSL